MVGPDLLIALIVLLVIVLIWRGPKNLPKIGQALGRTPRHRAERVAREVRRALEDRELVAVGREVAHARSLPETRVPSSFD